MRENLESFLCVRNDHVLSNLNEVQTHLLNVVKFSNKLGQFVLLARMECIRVKSLFPMGYCWCGPKQRSDCTVGLHRMTSSGHINPGLGPLESGGDAVHMAIDSLLLPGLSVAANRPPRVLLGCNLETCFTTVVQ